MENFVLKNGNYIAGVDFGVCDTDYVVGMIMKINDDGNCEIVDTMRLNQSKHWDKKRKEDYKKIVEKMLDYYPKRTKIGELQTLGDNDDRKILQVLHKGDYIIGYNGDRGTIIEVNYPYIVVEYAGMQRDIHITDVKQFQFN